MKLIFLFILISFCGICSIQGEMNKEALEWDHPLEIPKNWVNTGQRAIKEHVRKLTFAVKQQNVDQLENLFWSVSDPKSPQYAQYWNIDELTDLISPKEESIETLQTWISQYTDIPLIFTRNRDFAQIDLPLGTIEELLSCEFNIFKHETGRFLETSLGPYFVPINVKPHLDFISGVLGFPLVPKKHQSHHLAKDQEISPPIIRARYNVSEDLVCTNETNSHAVAEFVADYFSESDLAEFFNHYVTAGTQYDKVAKIVGPNQSKKPGLEPSLDIQYLMGVAPNASSWFISYGSTPSFWTQLSEWVAYLGNTTDIPLVHSVSYGSSQFADGFPSKEYRDRQNLEFQKLGLRGLTILIASGDNGVGCDKPIKKCYFQDDYPAESQYVTAVGATGFISGNSGPERAVNYPDEFTSGGGFSWLFDRPDYQNASVLNYLKSVSELPVSTSYNPNGRATPDVSALGSIEFEVICNGAVTIVGGTSASTPTFGGIVTLLNDVRLNAGLPPLGFLNPLLYQLAEQYDDAFFDVTVGNNFWPCGCDGLNGFLCSSGWDPATGLGTPNFSRLKTAVVDVFNK